MFLGRIQRKKRKVPLCSLPVAAKKPTVMSSIYRPPAHDVRGQEQQWFRACMHSHSAWCGCGNFILHMSSVAARLNFQGGPAPPGGPQRQRGPVRALLPLPAVPQEGVERNPWPTGTGGAAGGSGRDGGDGERGGPAVADEYREEDLDELFAAIEREE